MTDTAPMRLLLALAAVVVALPASSRADTDAEHGDAHANPHHFPIHHVAVFIGATSETRPRNATKHGFALGLEYGFRWREEGSAGALVEFVGDDEIVREVLALGLASLHFGDGFRVVVGPGAEFGEHGHRELVLRIGAGYEIVYGGGWTFAPEINLDLIGDDKTTFAYGLAFGKEL